MLRDIFSFSLEGIGVVTRNLDQISDELDRKIEETLKQLANHVIHDAKRLAPVSPPSKRKPAGGGDLEASLIVGDLKREHGQILIEMGNSPETDDYAVVQHEGFRKTKEGRVIYMSPGENTRSKGSYKGYAPGKKFLENALKINEELIVEELTKVLTP